MKIVVKRKNARAKKIKKNVNVVKKMKSVNAKMVNTKNVNVVKKRKIVNANMKNLNVVKRRKNVILKHY